MVEVIFICIGYGLPKFFGSDGFRDTVILLPSPTIGTTICALAPPSSIAFREAAEVWSSLKLDSFP
ncbi:hypothetical protein HPP92_020747 [Vanilla planifolia]|uniref:Uncharacterized protein n=1 Tax=Vanilla planifolia TaxID=51239 RepID=A0A835UGW5_VANPL|nr:hypothetical protein HPP92_020747 [Vanilla planifolia]